MSKYIPPPPVMPNEPKTKIIKEGELPRTAEYAKKPSVPKPPHILERYSDGRSVAINGVSGNDVMLGLGCLLVGIIFGLLLGRFV